MPGSSRPGRRPDADTRLLWQQRPEHLRRSGLTVADFCDRAGLSVASFYAWKRRLAEEALKYIRKLYKVERELAGRFAADDVAAQQQYRAAQAAAAREEFRAWLADQQPEALPKSPLGEPVRSALSHWEALARYTEQGYLSIDNNLSERTLRQVVVGRANWQFCGSAAGGDTAAALYNAVATCKHLGLDPSAYPRELLPALHALGDSPHEEALADWLPDAWQKRQQVNGPPAAVVMPA
jgi:hypothetical protein